MNVTQENWNEALDGVRNNALEEIYVSKGSWLRDSHASELAEALKDNTSLAYLTLLHETRIDCEGLLAIAKALEGSTILVQIQIKGIYPDRLNDKIYEALVKSGSKNIWMPWSVPLALNRMQEDNYRVAYRILQKIMDHPEQLNGGDVGQIKSRRTLIQHQAVCNNSFSSKAEAINKIIDSIINPPKEPEPEVVPEIEYIPSAPKTSPNLIREQLLKRRGVRLGLLDTYEGVER